MALAVVDALEIVEIEVGQAEGMPVAAAALDLGLERLEKMPAVPEAGEPVHPAELLLAQQRLPHDADAEADDHEEPQMHAGVPIFREPIRNGVLVRHIDGKPQAGAEKGKEQCRLAAVTPRDQGDRDEEEDRDADLCADHAFQPADEANQSQGQGENDKAREPGQAVKHLHGDPTDRRFDFRMCLR